MKDCVVCLKDAWESELDKLIKEKIEEIRTSGAKNRTNQTQLVSFAKGRSRRSR